MRAPFPAREKLNRPAGAGTVAEERGGYRVRASAAEGRASLGVYGSPAEAEAVAAAHAAGRTFGQRARALVEERAAQRGASARTERSCWRRHIDGDALARRPIADVTSADVRAWLTRLCAKAPATPPSWGRAGAGKAAGKLSRRAVAAALTLVRATLERAVEDGLVPANVALPVALPRLLGRAGEERFPGVLSPGEQTDLLLELPSTTELGCLLRLVMGLGLRPSEACSLASGDVDWAGVGGATVVVRRGKEGGPTKSRRARRLPLFGLAREALRVRALLWGTAAEQAEARGERLAAPVGALDARQGREAQHAAQAVKKLRVQVLAGGAEVDAAGVEAGARVVAAASGLGVGGGGADVDRAKGVAGQGRLQEVLGVRAMVGGEAAGQGGHGPHRAYLFPAAQGGRRRELPRAELAAACKRAGVKVVRWRDLRHTAATSLLLGWWGEPWPVRAVQEYLGHSSVEVTERYLHARPEWVFAGVTLPGNESGHAGVSDVRDELGTCPLSASPVGLASAGTAGAVQLPLFGGSASTADTMGKR